MTVEPLVQQMIGKFERKVEKDEKVREKVMPIEKTIMLIVDDETFSFRVKEGAVHDYKAEAIEEPDIMVSASEENFTALVEGDLRPMKAYVTKKVRIKGKIDDILHLKSLL